MKLLFAALALTYLVAPAHAAGTGEKPKPVVTKPQPKPTPWVCDDPVFACGRHSGG